MTQAVVQPSVAPGPRSGAGSARGAGEQSERRYELGWSTAVFIMTAVFLAIGAINSQNNLLFWAFGLSVGGLIVSGIVSGAALMGLRVERSAPALVRVGEASVVTYRVRNTARYTPAFGLTIRDEVEGGEPLETGLGHVGAGAGASVSSVLTPERRGVLRLRRVRVTSAAPFGLLRKTVVFDAPATIAVGPVRLPIRTEAATPTGHSAGPKRPDRRRVGAGEEFFGLREYRAGDSPRMIAWRSSARHGELVVKQMTPPAPPRCVVRLLAIPPGTPWGLAERTLALSAAAVEAACGSGMAVAFSVPWAGVLLPFSSGEACVRRVLLTIAEIDLDAASPEVGDGAGAAAEISGLPLGGRHGSVIVCATAPGRRVEVSDVVLVADDPSSWLAADAEWLAADADGGVLLSGGLGDGSVGRSGVEDGGAS